MRLQIKHRLRSLFMNRYRRSRAVFGAGVDVNTGKIVMSDADYDVDSISVTSFENIDTGMVEVFVVLGMFNIVKDLEGNLEFYRYEVGGNYRSFIEIPISDFNREPLNFRVVLVYKGKY